MNKDNNVPRPDNEIAETSLAGTTRRLYQEFGQNKKMGVSAGSTDLPHYFLHRTFLGEQDLVIIFNTKRCHYRCQFCDLPFKSTASWVPGDAVENQFSAVLDALKHSLSVLDRLTLSNEGSVFDSRTFPADTLLRIARCSRELRRVRTLVFETRLEFVDPELIRNIKTANPRAAINILTGFETLDKGIRNELLAKRESLDSFLTGLDAVARCKCDLTAYVLFKPSPHMTDAEAYVEADQSIGWLVNECAKRRILLTIRLNPMYAAGKSVWANRARQVVDYVPPSLADVLRLAETKRQQGINIYIGLASEDQETSWGNYRIRSDFSSVILKRAIVFNSSVSRSEPL